MCGIAGFCNRQKTWREDMERMKEQLISRGPDAEGSWCNDSQDVTLGHRRAVHSPWFPIADGL